MSRTMAGEHMIKALDTRLAKVRSTTAELERVGSFYSRIIELCVNNPPKDNRHLRALEEQVWFAVHEQYCAAAVILQVDVGVRVVRTMHRRCISPYGLPLFLSATSASQDDEDTSSC